MSISLKKICAAFGACMYLYFAAVPAFAADGPNIEDRSLDRQLHGIWQGVFMVPMSETTHLEDPVEMHYISADAEVGPKLYLTIQSFDSAYTIPKSWSVSDGEFSFSFNDQPWQADVVLKLESATLLTGTYTQYGKTYPLQMTKISDVPEEKGLSPQFVFEGKTGEEWHDLLLKYQSFAHSGQASIPFTYGLNEWMDGFRLISAAPFSQALYELNGSSDTEKMAAILEVFCDRFLHDGASGMPESLDAISVMEYADAHGGAVECRGLATMLSQILRTYGIPAKAVMCNPYTDPSEDCHVIVHAYAYDIGQWVMLDPSYCLMLRGEDGRYLSIPEVRDAFANGDPLYPNAEAGHNGTPFSMEFYRAYMTKNMFRFTCLTDNSFGSENNPNNRMRMLVPSGYVVQYPYSRSEIVTTDADSFWAAPSD